MTMPRRDLSPLLVAGALAAGALSGCTRDSDSMGAVTVRDSAGVEIVENAADVWAAPRNWRLSAEPVLHIGATEGEDPYLFDNVRGVVQLSDGRLVVANGGDNTIRWFEATGRFLFQRGGDGEGPGEFSWLSGLVLGAGDTIIATDRSTLRVTKFAADGSLGAAVHIVRLSVPPGVDMSFAPGPVYPLADGSYVMAGSIFRSRQLESSEPRLLRLATPLLRVSADGSRADTIGVFPGAELEVGPGYTLPARALGKELTYAPGPDGIYVGTQDGFTIDVYSPDGRLLRSIRAPEVDLTLYVEALKDTIRAQAPAEGQTAMLRWIDGLPLPETLPAFASFMIAADDNLWVERRQPDFARLPDYRPFAVFEPTGALVAILEIPGSFVPMTITSDRLIGRQTDDLGVEYVAVYAIERS